MVCHCVCIGLRVVFVSIGVLSYLVLLLHDSGALCYSRIVLRRCCISCICSVCIAVSCYPAIVLLCYCVMLLL